MAAAGFWAFLNLYSPQALLPVLSRELGVGAAGISSIMTASALAIAITAPFTGTLADVLGRKRVIVSAMVAVVLPCWEPFSGYMPLKIWGISAESRLPIPTRYQHGALCYTRRYGHRIKQHYH